MAKKRNKSPVKFSKKVVAMIIVLNVMFTLGIMFVYYKTGSEPQTLIACWFAFTTGELWLLSGIKIKGEQSNERINE